MLYHNIKYPHQLEMLTMEKYYLSFVNVTSDEAKMTLIPFSKYST